MLQRLNVDFVETLLTVALVTIVTEISIVDVVPPMTVSAAPAGPVHVLKRLVMAAMAMKFSMGLPEFEVCLVVVERPDQPVIRVMAQRTVLSERFFVYVIGAMAVDTLTAGVIEDRCGVTGLTARCGMLADQREIGQIVIKADILQPGNFAVTLIAFDALLALVHVVLFVTAVAGGVNFLGFGTEGVTGLARQAVVRAMEREIGISPMIEFCVRPAPDDMAILAFLAVQAVMRIVGTMAAVAISDLIFLVRNPVPG